MQRSNDSPQSRLISESDDSDKCDSEVVETVTSDLVLDGIWTGIGSGMSSSTWGVTCFESRQRKRCIIPFRCLSGRDVMPCQIHILMAPIHCRGSIVDISSTS
ncbi:hypothetical protein Q8A67_021472 [Cirrhinus molitorella]|uniref:Uncharacterized protein n=1 Tax=Cirrhinus molitorella TaxID=172907 RepID=A0AA88P3M8_9TELE|nr:hypothetical protein Q8A67_021472 [Cirrhinus molitorella]